MNFLRNHMLDLKEEIASYTHDLQVMTALRDKTMNEAEREQLTNTIEVMNLCLQRLIGKVK